jgi:HSP20 family protein
MAGLVPFNRFRPAGFEDFYNMLDDFFNDTRPIRRSLSRDTFKIDVQDNEKEYIIEAELPGVAKDEISLQFNEGKLSIAINKEENIEEEKKNYIHKERRVSSMQRSLYLADAQADEISAKLEEGVLTLTVPKQNKRDSSVKISID